ncbi:hypothetical protein CA14_004497 [Aspergillus flavus]|uniref:Transcription factor domain-containing protein n=1 Tax=Aspergillus flavus TaxID=5059 RepID=A0AB74BYF7_ASPFL|nr:hypothetical protein CA14_004497 [Aspergillus flavus]
MSSAGAASSSVPPAQHGKAPIDDLFDTGCGKIPTEAFTRIAATAFFSGVASLFYVILPEDCDRLIHRLYQEETDIERCEVCELSAIAAVGCRYDSAEIPNEYIDKFWEQSLLLVYDAIDEADLRALRILICMGMYLILDKSMSATVIIASGMSLARRCMPKQDSNDGSKAEWDGLFHSLATIECWLSFALGFEHCLTEEDTQYVIEQDIAETSTVVSETPNYVTASMIRSQMWKVSFMSAEVYKRIRSIPSLSWNEFERVSSELDTWRQELSGGLQLQALASHNNGLPPEQRRGLLQVHMVYLENRMLLFQHFLQRHTESKLLQMNANTRQIYAAFAHQLAWIISIIYLDKWPFVRNWLVIHAAFHCSITLLSIICQCHIAVQDLEQVTDYQSDIKICVEVLTYCSRVDTAAARLVQTVHLLGEGLEQAINHPQQALVPREELMRIWIILNEEFPGRRFLLKTSRELVHKMTLAIPSGS